MMEVHIQVHVGGISEWYNIEYLWIFQELLSDMITCISHIRLCVVDCPYLGPRDRGEEADDLG